MAHYTGRDARQKEFIKLFDTLLTGSYTRWQVWDDMVWMFATTIANTIQTRHWQKREDDYLKRIAKYKRQEQMVFPELFALLVQTIDESVKAGRYGDFLGELFMLMELGNDHGGQFSHHTTSAGQCRICRLQRRCRKKSTDKGTSFVMILPSERGQR